MAAHALLKVASSSSGNKVELFGVTSLVGVGTEVTADDVTEHNHNNPSQKSLIFDLFRISSRIDSLYDRQTSCVVL